MYYLRPASRCTAMFAVLFTIASASMAEESIDLTAGPRNALPQTVTVALQLGGDLLVPTADNAAEGTKLNVSAEATLSYDEALLPGDAIRSARYYHTVEGKTNVAGRERAPKLRESRRLVVAGLDSAGRQYAAVDGLLHRDELDVLDLAGDSLVLDTLLPEHPVQKGDTWQHEPAIMQTLTGLDSVGHCEASSVLMEMNKQFARCRMGGVVHGVVHGASTELKVDVVYLVDRQQRRITQLNMAIREQREIGPATPGLDAVAKLRVKIEPALSNSPLTSKLIARAADTPLNETPSIETRSTRLGFVTRHDAQWHAISERGNELSLRFVATEGLVAHGNLAKLPAKPIDPQTALAEFRSDILNSLGKDATGVVSEAQWINQNGCRVMSVVVAGNVLDTPVEWHAYQVAPPAESEQLHRLALSFTVEQSELERLANHDRDLVDHIELIRANERQAQLPNGRK